MWAQLPDLCQGSSIKPLCIRIPLWRGFPHHSLWELPPLQLCKGSRQSCDLGDTGWGFATNPLLTPAFCPGTGGKSVVTSPEQRSACKCSPAVSTAGFSLAKGNRVLLCIAGTVLIDFSLDLVRPLFQTQSKCHTDSLKQEKIALDSS